MSTLSTLWLDVLNSPIGNPYDVSADARIMLEAYAEIPTDEIVSHVIKMVRESDLLMECFLYFL